MKRVFVAFALLFSVTVVRAVFIGADCEFTGSVVNGVITFNQATEEEGIIMDISLTGSGLNNNTWHIHVYSVQNNSCAVTSGHYNPSGYPTYGELSDKFGNIDTSPYVRTFNSSENKLSGPLSIVGRSIVIHAATGARIACCTIALRSGASFTPVPPVLVDDDVTAGCELIGAVTGSFTFVQQKVEGQDASTPVAFPVGSRIYVNVSNVETDGSGNGYHIHTGPVGPNGECSAAYTGGHYNPQNNLDFNGNNSGVYTLYGVGELSNKHGYLNTSSVLKSYLDNSVVLTGDFSVAGRSVVIHNATNPASRIACCNITSLASNPTPSAPAPSLKAQCTFDVGNATGAIYLTQPIGSFGTIINLTSIAITNSAEQGPHNYHIHQWGPVKSSQSCSATATGGHYYPDDGIGPDQYGITWASYNQLMEVGDLSGKHGQLVPGVDVSYYDGQVALSGPYSVVGRAIVIHSISGPARIACCTIGLVENFVPPATTDGSTTGIVTSVMTTGAEGLTTESSASSHVTVSLFMVFVALFSLL